MIDTTELSAEDVGQAHARLRSHVRATPLLESDELNALTGRRVLVKAECLQRSGSFKFRGAMNRLLTLTPEERAHGVVAFSSGNHGKAVALAARLLGVRATIVMPSDAPRAKVAGASREGAEVVLYDRENEDREVIAHELTASSGATLVPPYDDPRIIAGQGTIAWEVAAELASLEVAPSHFIVPCSGGGLAAGCALVMRRTPDLRMVVVEPEGFDDTTRSLAAGSRVTNANASGSICDALLVRTPGAWTFPLLQRAGALGMAVSDSEVLAAMKLAASCLKLVLEPGGAAGLAAVLSGRLGQETAPVVVVASGGNADDALLRRALAEESGTECMEGSSTDA